MQETVQAGNISVPSFDDNCDALHPWLLDIPGAEHLHNLCG